MSLQFLFPNWLWALSLISIPIIIHLFNFRRYKLVYFTNVHLLKEVKKDTQSKTRLKEWLILLARILLIIFLVLAFAQPVWVNLDKQKQYSNQSDLTIIVDNSFSMSAEGTEGILLESAKLKAIDIVNAYPASTKIMVLSTEVLARQFAFKSKEESYTSISKLNVSPFTHSLNKLLDFVRNRLSSNAIQHHIYLISDFQKRDYERNSITDSNFQVFLVPLESQKRRNILLDTAYFHSPIHNLFEDEHLIFSISNYGDDDIMDYNIELFINDSLKAILSVDIKAGSTVLDTINYRNTSSGMKIGRISISDFPLTFDNDLHFNYFIKKNLKIGIYSDTGFNTYLDAFFKNNRYYETHYFDINNLDMNYWNNSDVIIINTNSTISTGVLEQIQQHSSLAKPLIVFANDKEKNPLLWNYIGVSFRSLDSLQQQISAVNINSNLYKNAFSKVEDKIDLPHANSSISILNYNEWLVRTKTDEVLVALQKRENKNVLIFSNPMNEENRNFYTHPIFIPLMYNFMFDAQKYPIYYHSMMKNSIYLTNEIVLGDGVFNIRRGEEQWIPEQYSVNSGIKIHLPTDLESGYYSISYQNQETTGFSINYDRKESVPEFYSISDLKSNELLNDNIQVLEPEKINSNSIAQNITHKKELWYFSILLALLFLAAEILLIKFWRK